MNNDYRCPICKGTGKRVKNGKEYFCHNLACGAKDRLIAKQILETKKEKGVE